MKLTHEAMANIAKSVLKSYNVHPSVSNAFRKGSKNHRLFYSENASKTFPAILYWLDNVPEFAEKAKTLADNRECLPFHAILTHTEFGDLLDILFVPSELSEYEEFIAYARKGMFRSYCYNLADGFGEFGYILVKPAMGGIQRIA